MKPAGRDGSGVLRRARKLVGPVLVLLVAVFLVRALVSSWDEVRDYRWSFDFSFLTLSVGLMFLYYAQQWGGWRLVMRSFGDPLSRSESVAIWFATILGRYVPGSVAMVAGRVVMCQRRGIPARDTLASIVYENALILISALVVTAASVPFWPDFEYRPYALLLVVLAPVGLAMIHPKVFRRAANFALKKTNREPLEKTLSFGRVLALLAYYVGGWVLLGLAFACLTASVAPVEFSLPEVALLIGGYAFAWEVGFLSLVTPSGLGVKEAVLALVLSLVLPVPAVVAVVVLSRLWQTLVELACAGAVWAFFKGTQALRNR
ncbi:lysylphosphatidylglycerol synthase domain-containing protein [Rubrobacter indicoceani]|uniref:lysylphosphatidylglycerol synthase domain-containing protein n=1 Tax=Rubrobacter indicoceani TaxID=2051957 RepID=UPI0013C44F21|nr:lysylphosphatidylglycerol synthase domain-containing protein [Rubrobacter indicoceani]